MAKRKPKTPPISDARRKIFDEYKVDIEQQLKIHEMLERDFDKLVPHYEKYAEAPIKGDTHEETGNNIIRAYLESQKKENDRIASNVSLYMAYADQFFRVFGRKLKPYWDYRLGFDIVAFDTNFIKSSDDESVAEAIASRFGAAAHQLVKTLMGIKEECSPSNENSPQPLPTSSE